MPHSSRVSSIAGLPVIDLEAPRTEVARAVRAACRDTGFFYLVNHGVPSRVVQETFAQSARFFGQDEAAKMAVFHKQSRGLQGYEPLCAQSLDGVSPPDLKESYYCSFDLPDSHPYVVAGLRTFGANQWPAGLTGFREAMLSHLASITLLGHEVLRLFALSLNLPEDHFDPMFGEASCHLRVVHYPPQPASALDNNQIGAGAHSDWGALTLLAQDDAGGLQVRNVAGEWVFAQPVPGSFIVNIGDLMARWTNDFYRSSLHRVINNVSGRERFSAAFFFGPDPEARIECLPTCTDAANPARYPACTAGEHMREMVARTYGKGAGTEQAKAAVLQPA